MKRLVILITAACWLISFGLAVAGDFESDSFDFPKDDIQLLVLNISLGAGTFYAVSEDMDNLAKGTIDYDRKKVRISYDYVKDGSTGFLDLTSEHRKKLNIDSDDNNWDIVLSKKYSTELTTELGACKADFDLGGIPLTYFSLDIGAAEGKVDFSTPNPDEMVKMEVDAGAASLKIKHLGNANFRRLKFEGGVGDFEIDFSGNYRTKSRAVVSIGLGSAKIYIPRDLPVSVEADDNFLSSVEFIGYDGKEIEDNFMETDNFRKSDYGLDLEVDVGLGSVEIIWID